MKRLIALLIAAVFCTVLFSPPVVAWCPAYAGDNEKPTPLGDDSGWVDPDESPGGKSVIIVEVLSYFKMYTSNYFVAFFVGKRIDNRDTAERNDFTNNTSFSGGRGASSK